MTEAVTPILIEPTQTLDTMLHQVLNQALVAIGAKALWLQQDIVSEEAGRIADAGGLTVIMGICIRQTALRLEREVRGG